MRFYLPGSHTSDLNLGMYNVWALLTLTKNQFWENLNGNFVKLNTMTIFITLYEILDITGGEINLRFKAGAILDGKIFFCIKLPFLLQFYNKILLYCGSFGYFMLWMLQIWKMMRETYFFQTMYWWIDIKKIQSNFYKGNLMCDKIFIITLL